jgi:hypothetical protein
MKEAAEDGGRLKGTQRQGLWGKQGRNMYHSPSILSLVERPLL